MAEARAGMSILADQFDRAGQIKRRPGAVGGDGSCADADSRCYASAVAEREDAFFGGFCQTPGNDSVLGAEMMHIDARPVHESHRFIGIEPQLDTFRHDLRKVGRC